MDRRYRKTIIAGNWKMNKAVSDTKEFCKAILASCNVKATSVVLCVPAIDIVPAQKALKSTRIAVGAQNCHFEESGAFTGEISAKILADSGVKYVIIGHSERRQMFGETDETVNKKVLAALSNGLRPIICVGETLEQREAGILEEHLRIQIKKAIAGVPMEKMSQVVIAYEPIWAIGTGKTATPEDAEAVCKLIRVTLRELYSARTARSVSILYGGSMNEKNASALLSQIDIDGGLIGGASLVPEKFEKIVEASK